MVVSSFTPGVYYPMKNVFVFKSAISLSCGLLVSLATSAFAVDWTGAAGSQKWEDPKNWKGNTLPTRYGGSDEGLASISGEATVNLSSSQKITAMLVGTGQNADGILNILPGTLLQATAENKNSRVGAGRNGQGIVRQSGGEVEFHMLQIGLDDSAYGSYSLSGGQMTITRENKGVSMTIGENGIGEFSISGDAKLTTRAGVQLGTDKSGLGTFEVIGSKCKIGIGLENNLDGCWIQKSGSTLKARVDADGIAYIYVADSDKDGVGGDVVFEEGSLLDVGFADAKVSGRWVLMEWQGKSVNNGLKFAPSVDTAVWDFELIETNDGGQLRIVAR